MSRPDLLNKDQVVTQFISKVQRKLKTRLQKAYLFGSRARGDAWEGSDYDIALIVDQRDRSLEETILDVCTFTLDQFNVLISTHIFSEQEWQLESRCSLGKNIIKEGIEL